MPTRRQFIVNCSALATTAALAPVVAMAGRPAWRESIPEDFSVEVFAAQANSVFVARDSGGNATSLRLVTVEANATDGGTAATASAKGQVREQFSILFAGDASQPLTQETYQFEHARLGRFEMFIVPVGRPSAEGCVYEAVFDRFVSRPQVPRRHGRAR